MNLGLKKVTVLLLPLLVITVLFVTGYGVEGTQGGRVDARWTTPNPAVFNNETKFHPGEKITLSSSGKFCYFHTDYTYEESVFLFWSKEVHVNFHNMIDADKIPPAVTFLNSSGAALILQQSVPPQGATVEIPGFQLQNSYRVAALIPDKTLAPDPHLPVVTFLRPIDRQNSCQEQFLTLNITNVDATPRLSLLNSHLSTARRSPTEIEAEDVLCPHLRKQFPAEVAAALIRHYDDFYKNATADDLKSKGEALLKLTLEIRPGDLKATSALAEYYARAGDPRAEKTLFEAVEAARRAVANKPSIENQITLGTNYSNLALWFAKKREGITPEDYERADLYYAQSADAFLKARDYSGQRDALVARSRILQRIRSMKALRASVEVLKRARNVSPQGIEALPVAVSPDGRHLLARSGGVKGVSLISPDSLLDGAHIYKSPEEGVSWRPLAIDQETGRILVRQGVSSLMWLTPGQPQGLSVFGSMSLAKVQTARGFVLGIEANKNNGRPVLIKPDGTAITPNISNEPSAFVTEMVLSASANKFVVCVRDNTPAPDMVKVFDTNGKLLKSRNDFFPSNLQFSPDGDVLMGTVWDPSPSIKDEDRQPWVLWDLSKDELIKLPFLPKVGQLASNRSQLSPDGKKIVAATLNDGLIFYNRAGQKLSSIPLPGLSGYNFITPFQVREKWAVVLAGKLLTNISKMELAVVNIDNKSVKRIDIKSENIPHFMESNPLLSVSNDGNVSLVINPKLSIFEVYRLPEAEPVSAVNILEADDENDGVNYHLLNGGRYFIKGSISNVRAFDTESKQTRIYDQPLIPHYTAFGQGLQMLPAGTMGFSVQSGNPDIDYSINYFGPAQEFLNIRNLGQGDKWAVCHEKFVSAEGFERGCTIYNGLNEIGFQPLKNSNRFDFTQPAPPPYLPPPPTSLAFGAVTIRRGKWGGPTNTSAVVPFRVFGHLLLDRPFPNANLDLWSLYNLAGPLPKPITKGPGGVADPLSNPDLPPPPQNIQTLTVSVPHARGALPLLYTPAGGGGFLFIGGLRDSTPAEKNPQTNPGPFGVSLPFFGGPTVLWWQTPGGNRKTIKEGNPFELLSTRAAASSDGKMIALSISKENQLDDGAGDIRIFEVTSSGDLQERPFPAGSTYTTKNLGARFKKEQEADRIGEGFLDPFSSAWLLKDNLIVFPQESRLVVYNLISNSLIAAVELGVPLAINQDYLVTLGNEKTILIWSLAD